MLARVLNSAMDHLEKLPNKTWGALHQMHFHHLLSAIGVTDSLNEPPISIGGDTNTICNTSNTAVDDFTANGANISMRCVYDCCDLGKHSYMTMPLGQSAVPGSLHYGDRTATWAAGSASRILQDLQEVNAAAKYHGIFVAKDPSAPVVLDDHETRCDLACKIC